ncbi:MAG: hypothetical protein MHM6MM_000578 [Cercozoa sp. M6MM]
MAAHQMPRAAPPRVDLTSVDAVADDKGTASGLQRYRMDVVRAKTLYGVIRMAEDTTTGTPVVVKQCDKRLVAAKRTRSGEPIEEDVAEEARLHGKISADTGCSVHVLKHLDTFETTRYIFLVLELAAGGEMFNHVGDRPPVTDPARLAQRRHLGLHPNEVEAREYARQLFLGVAYLHSRRVCHRDLSLENLMLDHHRRLKIIDFGLALQYPADNAEFRTPAKPVGKLGYMSPEVYDNREYDARANDMWCCGIIVFILLVGAPPYKLPAANDPRFRLLSQGRMKELLEHWRVAHHFSDEALNFVQSLLLADVRRRATLPQVLRHPWLNITQDEMERHGISCEPESIYESSVSLSDDDSDSDMVIDEEQLARVPDGASASPFGHGAQIARTANDF